jgi:methyl-accepting chemotaxis protein
MKLFRNMPLTGKLASGFAVPIALVVGLSALSYQSINALGESADWVSHTHEAVSIGTTLGGAMIDMETGLRGFVIAGKEKFLEPYTTGQQTFKQAMSKGLDHVNDNPVQVERLQKIATLKDAWLAQHAVPSIQLRKQVAGGAVALEDVVSFIEEGHGKIRMDKIRGILELFIDAEYKLIAVRSDEETAIASQSINIAVFGAIIVVCMGLLATFIITNAIVGPVRKASRLAKSIMEGKLNNVVEINSTDELGTLLSSLKAMQDKLSDLVGEISVSAEKVLSSSHEISRGNSSLSDRTNEQAASLEKTAASMEQITTTVKLSADNANEANTLAAGAREQAESGSAIVSKAVVAMKEINDASSQIADITAVIDELAFQTNLLALNAAVEAARAGEQGRGFAVVAAEVGSLAQRSASSAREIKSLIQDSVGKVEEGSKLVFESGQMLNEIVESVSKVNDTVEQITLASQEQRTGIEQVNSAVIYIDEMTEKNTVMVREAAQTSESMSTQAEYLSQLVGYFTTSEEQS